MSRPTLTLDYRLYLMALVLEEHLHTGALQGVRVRSKQGDEFTF